MYLIVHGIHGWQFEISTIIRMRWVQPVYLFFSIEPRTNYWTDLTDMLHKASWYILRSNIIITAVSIAKNFLRTASGRLNYVIKTKSAKFNFFVDICNQVFLLLN